MEFRASLSSRKTCVHACCHSNGTAQAALTSRHDGRQDALLCLPGAAVGAVPGAHGGGVRAVAAGHRAAGVRLRR